VISLNLHGSAARATLAGAALATLAACAQTSSLQTAPQHATTGLAPRAALSARDSQRSAARRLTLGKGKIQHVVIIFQENRTPDDLFNGLPGADTVTVGSNTAGAQVKLHDASLVTLYDLNHSHASFNTDFDGGRMDGFNLERSSCLAPHNEKCPTKPAKDVLAYGMVPQKEVAPYFAMAKQYAFADRMFATQEGPSFPAHQYIISGASTISQGSSVSASENPLNPQQRDTGGCDSPAGSLVTLIDANGAENQQVFPCFERPSLTDLIDAQHLSWRYYEAHVGPGLWNAPDAIKHVRDSSEYSVDVVSPPTQVLTDIAGGNLANVVWVTPTAQASDHAGITDGTGPSWVASIVNAIGKSSYWDTTAIFVVWDDWGGWYDHVPPPQYNSYELGFRVPLLAIAPYAKKGYVSHVQHEFGSVLKFTEEIFSLGSLGATDVRADDLADCFNFAQKPRKFKQIPSSRGAAYFLRQPVSPADPDDD
jgi:phospholipase C